jgi:hypothetical protein
MEARVNKIQPPTGSKFIIGQISLSNRDAVSGLNIYYDSLTNIKSGYWTFLHGYCLDGTPLPLCVAGLVCSKCAKHAAGYTIQPRLLCQC